MPSSLRPVLIALLLAALLLTALPPAALAPAQVGAARGGEPALESGAVVLMYHRFGEGQYPSTNIRLEQFRAHLRALQKPPYTVLPVPEIVAALREGRTLPPYAVGITIDDAYRSIYTEAWPLLRAARLPFTVFVATDAVDRSFRDLMNWQQLRELVDSGLVTLGNHSATHPHLADARRARVRAELEQAGRRIEQETGQRPTLLAYPYGEYSTVVRKVAEELGFAAAFGQHSGAIGPGMDLLTLPRYALNEHYGEPERFRLVIDSLPLPVRDAIPPDMLLSSQNNPPLFGFTVAKDVGGLERLTCYVSGQGALVLKRIGARRVEGRPGQPFPPGRSRINCTLPGPQGRWRWYGVQFYLPGS